MFLEAAGSSIFGAADIKLESALKNPNQFREAVIFETLNGLPSAKRKEFIKSNEAKTMLTEGLITKDMLDRLASESDNGVLKTTVCHMAKENGDPIWDEFVRCRIEERRIMNELIAKYGEDAKPIADNTDKDFVESCIPEYFRK